MIQPTDPVISALRQDLVQLKKAMGDMEKNIEVMNQSIQEAFLATTRTTGMSLKFLDARIDDLEITIEQIHKRFRSIPLDSLDNTSK